MLVTLWLIINIGTVTKPVVISETIAFNGFFACDAYRTKTKRKYGKLLYSSECIGSKHGDSL